MKKGFLMLLIGSLVGILIIIIVESLLYCDRTLLIIDSGYRIYYAIYDKDCLTMPAEMCSSIGLTNGKEVLQVKTQAPISQKGKFETGTIFHMGLFPKWREAEYKKHLGAGCGK